MGPAAQQSFLRAAWDYLRSVGFEYNPRSQSLLAFVPMIEQATAGAIVRVAVVRVYSLQKDSRVKAEQSEQRRESQALMLSKFTAPLGIDRLQSAIHFEKPEPAFGLSADLIEEFDYLDRQLKTREAVLSESAAMLESGKMARDSGTLDDRPTIVLTGGKMEFTPDPLFTNDVQEKLRNLWMNVLQVEEAHLSTRGKQVILKDSGHVIRFERPDAVIDSARQVWAEVRAINSSKHRR